MKNQRSKVSKRKGKRWKHFLVNNVWVKENWLKNNFCEKPNPDFVFSWNESLTLFLIILSISLNFPKEIFGWIDYNQLSSIYSMLFKFSWTKDKAFEAITFLTHSQVISNLLVWWDTQYSPASILFIILGSFPRTKGLSH